MGNELERAGVGWPLHMHDAARPFPSLSGRGVPPLNPWKPWPSAPLKPNTPFPAAAAGPIAETQSRFVLCEMAETLKWSPTAPQATRLGPFLRAGVNAVGGKSIVLDGKTFLEFAEHSRRQSRTLIHGWAEIASHLPRRVAVAMPVLCPHEGLILDNFLWQPGGLSWLTAVGEARVFVRVRLNREGQLFCVEDFAFLSVAEAAKTLAACAGRAGKDLRV